MDFPEPATKFEVSINGQSIAAFSELLGISSRAGSVDFIPSGDDETLLLNRFAGVRTPTTLKFVRSRSKNPAFSAWYVAAARNPTTGARDCSLVLYTLGAVPIATYYLERAWPAKIEIGTLTFDSGRTAESETVTITCEFLRRAGI